MTQNSFKVAVTGGIASGKSTVVGIIGRQGYPVFSCDEVYEELLCDERFLKKLSDEFGDIIAADGSLDRKKLSAIVFNDGEKLKKLNSITHPDIMRRVLKRAEECKLSFCEVPLLFENGFEKFFDAVIVVLRDREERINYLTKRDNLTREEAVLRLNSQFNYDNCDFAKYYVIHNCSDLSSLRKKTLEILAKIEVQTK